jgi:hypothetical protein
MGAQNGNALIRFRTVAALSTVCFALTCAETSLAPAYAQTAPPPVTNRNQQPAGKGPSAGSQQPPATLITLVNLQVAGFVMACDVAITHKVPLNKAISSALAGQLASLSMVNNLTIQGIGQVPLVSAQEEMAIRTIKSVKESKECYSKLPDSDRKWLDGEIVKIDQAIKARKESQKGK